MSVLHELTERSVTQGRYRRLNTITTEALRVLLDERDALGGDADLDA